MVVTTSFIEITFNENCLFFLKVHVANKLAPNLNNNIV